MFWVYSHNNWNMAPFGDKFLKGEDALDILLLSSVCVREFPSQITLGVNEDFGSMSQAAGNRFSMHCEARRWFCSREGLFSQQSVQSEQSLTLKIWKGLKKTTRFLNFCEAEQLLN
jgi:hypothetical protein